jgi:hypothetical protein
MFTMTNLLGDDDLLAIGAVVEQSIQRTVPPMIEQTIQRAVPPMIERSMQRTVPTMIEQSIKKTVPDIVRNIVQPMFDKLDDVLSSQAADGFAEIHAKLDIVNRRLQTSEDRYDDNHIRLDNHEVRIAKLEQINNSV